MKKLIDILNFYKWILKYDTKKYLGILIMIIAPLFFLYRYIYIRQNIYELIIGTFSMFVIGILIWISGADPYEV